MKLRITLLVLPLLLSFATIGQILTPAKWEISVSKTSVSVGDELEIVLKATIDPVWYMSSLNRNLL
jgi:hypothetical protein